MRACLATAVTVALACTWVVTPLTATTSAAAVSAAPPASPSDGPAPGSVVPDQDPFYAAPPDIGDYHPGQIVATRPVPDVNLYGIPVPVDAWQIAYRTDDSHDRPELAVTTLLVPRAAWIGHGARPVVSLQSPEDSLGTQCAPSYLIATGHDAQDTALGGELLLANWAVAVPDFEGPKSAFMAGPQAGHAVLDGIRALRSFDTDGVGPANPLALDGYSGGAEATGWAAQLQPSYAPDVRLVGAAMGGTPADPTAVARSLDGTALSGLEFAGFYSLATEFPEAGIDSLLNDRGRQDSAAIRGECETAYLPQFAIRKLADDTTVADPLDVPSVAAVLRENALGAAAPATPVYDYHADTDDFVPVGQDDTLVRDWCARGTTVQEVRDPVGEHVEEAAVREESVLVFLTARFAGASPANTC